MSHAAFTSRGLSALALATTALLFAGSALAAENLYGGGATFPAVPYVGSAYLTPNPDARLSTNITGHNPGPGFTVAGIGTGSVFAAYTTNTTNKIGYCQTGSGLGKQTLTGAVAANQSCRDFSASPVALSAGAAQPDFTGTDSPISTNDYNAFNSNTALLGARTGIVQVPTLAGAIALPHNASVNGVTQLQLTVPQICAIYSAKVKTWNNVRSDGTYNTTTGVAVGTGNINIVYRTDGSGTTFAFTSFLRAKCNPAGQPHPDVPAGFVFAPNQSFAAAIPGGVAIYAASTAASGNNGVVTAVRTTVSNGLGYADFGEVAAQTGTKFAHVGTTSATYYSPATFGSTGPISINPTYLKQGQVLDGATLNAAPGSQTATVKNCLLVVDPAAPISGTYPIAAITYLNAYYGGNGTAAKIQALKDLLGIFYNVNPRPTLPAGFAYVNGNAIFNSTVAGSTGKINTCIN
ncbi:substrate-binding domain-containing protein [Luteimonas aquatica]|uniref:substrate-binding domain-containing protein n=1 Tax=Luteimonas aquatica TaxID=450364 RepID=UPI001F5A2B0C|nr:substrate-binding domain-containing protein [Luteimonas aquatica]